MAQDKILGEQLEIVDVASDIAADPTAIDSIATGVVNDPTAVANLEAGIDHNNLINSGSPLHFTEASIDHANIVGAGTNTHAMIDLHLAVGSPPIHFTEASINHDNILNGTGLYSHGDIDTHVGNNTIHFSALTGLSDVDTTGVTAGQVLTYSNSPAGWTAEDASGGGGGVTNPMTADLDVGGFVLTAADTVGVGSPVDSAGAVVIESGSSTFVGAGSYAGKLTIKGGDRAYNGYWDSGVIPAGSPLDRDSISILAGSGGGYGGGIELLAGNDGGAQYGGGGYINITAGEATHAVNAYSGTVYIKGGAHNATYYGGTGGNVELTGGYSKHGYAGDIFLRSGTGAGGGGLGGSGNVNLYGSHSAGYSGGGSIQLKAGDALAATGSPPPPTQSAGQILIRSGSASLADAATAGSKVIIQAGNASSSGDQNGGDITLQGGLKGGLGTAGVISALSEIDMNNRNIRDVNSIYYRDEQDIGTFNTVQFTLRNHIKASPSGPTTYAFSVFGFLRTGHYQLRLVDGLNNNPTWPSTVKWQNNTEPTWTANTDIITFYYDFVDGNYYATNVALGFV